MADAKSDESQTVPEVLSDLLELVKQYAQQETLDPLKNLGRFFKLGFSGAFLTAFGACFLILSALRVLQTETGSTFTGNLSWAPYLITFLGAVVIIGLAVLRANKRGNST
ncbi:MAG TPA: hypothetical protein VMW08_01800 [Acidimicrobiales bacterium]|nr:hypothetical protein [Acidimicrobiales bacterium]